MNDINNKVCMHFNQSSFRTPIHSRVSNQVYALVADRFRDQVWAQVWNQVGSQVWNQVWIQRYAQR